MKLKDIINFMEEKFPLSYAEEFDNPGLLAGKCENDITGVLLCLDCDKNIVDEARLKGAQLIISHHPVIFSPIKSVTDKTNGGEMLVKAIENGISIYSAHTNLDSAPGGLTDTVCDMLGIVPTGTMEGVLGRICDAPDAMTISALCRIIKEKFNIQDLYTTACSDRSIKKIAVCNGGGGGEMCDAAIASGADIYISGDLKHHELREFMLTDGIDFIEMRHYDSEKIVTSIIKKALSERFGSELEIFISETEKSPLSNSGSVPLHPLRTLS